MSVSYSAEWSTLTNCMCPCKQAVTSWLTHPWFPTSSESRAKLQLLHIPSIRFATGLWERLTREKGKELSNEFPLIHTHWAICITSCSDRKNPGFPSLSISSFCLVLANFSFSPAASGTFHFLTLKYSAILTVFQLHKNPASLHCWSFMGMTSF